MKKIVPIMTCFLLMGSSQLYAAIVTLSDYVVPASPGRSWTYVFTHDTPSYGIAGEEITVTDPVFPPLVADQLPPMPETGTLYLIEPSTGPDDGNIYAYFEIIDSLTVPAGTFNDVLAVSWIDDKFPKNPVNDDPRLAIDPAIVDFGVTDADWLALGVGEIKFLGVSAADGSIDGGIELITSTVPVPAAVWLFGSGLIGLAGVARRKK